MTIIVNEPSHFDQNRPITLREIEFVFGAHRADKAIGNPHVAHKVVNKRHTYMYVTQPTPYSTNDSI